MIRRIFVSPIFLGVLAIVFLSLVGLKSLIANPFYTSHDGYTHTARIASYYHALKDGQWPPRWATNLNGGLGSPIFVYIYQLPYFLGSLIHTVGISYTSSFRLVIGIGYVLSGITAFLWLKNKFGNLPGLLGGIFYIWVPYRFLNLYVRAAIAESFAYIFLPLVLLSIEKICEKKYRWLVVLTFSTAGLFLSHNVVAAISIPIVISWVFINYFANKRDLKSLTLCVAGFLWGFLISAFIYFPDLFERQFVRFDSNISYFREHFVVWWQLIRSPWGYGFDFDGYVRDEMSFQLGLGQLLVFVLSILVFVKSIFTNRVKTKEHILETTFIFLLLFVTVFLMVDSKIARSLWEVAPGLKTIVDFPWRFLGISALCFAYLASYFLSSVKLKKLLFIFLVLSILIANRNHIRVNKAENFPDKEFDSYKGTATATSNEFTPLWHDNVRFDEAKTLVEVETGNPISFSTIYSNAKGASFEVRSSSDTILKINRFYFPQTTIYQDTTKLMEGVDYEVISARTTLNSNDTGLIRLKNGLHNGIYKLVFSDTPVRKLGNIVSGVSAVLLLTSFVYFLLRFKKLS